MNHSVVLSELFTALRLLRRNIGLPEAKFEPLPMLAKGIGAIDPKMVDEAIGALEQAGAVDIIDLAMLELLRVDRGTARTDEGALETTPQEELEPSTGAPEEHPVEALMEPLYARYVGRLAEGS